MSQPYTELSPELLSELCDEVRSLLESACHLGNPQLQVMTPCMPHLGVGLQLTDLHSEPVGCVAALCPFC